MPPASVMRASSDLSLGLTRAACSATGFGERCERARLRRRRAAAAAGCCAARGGGAGGGGGVTLQARDVHHAHELDQLGDRDVRQLAERRHLSAAELDGGGDL